MNGSFPFPGTPDQMGVPQQRVQISLDMPVLHALMRAMIQQVFQDVDARKKVADYCLAEVMDGLQQFADNARRDPRMSAAAISGDLTRLVGQGKQIVMNMLNVIVGEEIYHVGDDIGVDDDEETTEGSIIVE